MSKFVLIGDRLKEEREKLGLNQSEFAAIGGAGRKTQYNYESGERVPDAAYLAAIAAAGADVLYILTGQRAAPYIAARAELVPTGEPQGVYVTDQRKLALLDNYEHATEEGKRAVESVALLGAEAKHKEVKPNRKRNNGE